MILRVLTNAVARMRETGTLIASVPNSVSYKTLQEFMTGAPPWTYWFYHPDLGHEPRHAFEPTPIFFKAMLRSAGLREEAFRTICAYADRQSLDQIFAVGEALSVEPRFFGDTMIAQATKIRGADTIRFPDLIYSGDAYYQVRSHPSSSPAAGPRHGEVPVGMGALAEMGPLRAALQKRPKCRPPRKRLLSSRTSRGSRIESNRELQSQTAEALALCSGYEQALTEKTALLDDLRGSRDETANYRLKPPRRWPFVVSICRY